MITKLLKSCFSTVPNVWVNKHTKVICQGITGNQVGLLSLRELSKLSQPSTMEHKWLEESTLKKQVLLIWVFLSSKTVCKPKRALDAMPQ